MRRRLPIGLGLLLSVALGTGGLAAPAVAAPAPALPTLHAVAVPGSSGYLADEQGRRVLLRGVNDNSLGEYYRNNRFPPTFPFAAGDPAVMRDMGWNVVRLVVSWSRVEPRPGRYDGRYLAAVAAVVARLAREQIYTIVDMHQDAWGPAAVAAPGTSCPPGLVANLGYDGAPGWASLGLGLPHCYAGGQKEASPAVAGSWQAFFADAPGPGGVGIATRFVAMWAHVAGYFARSSDVVGFDLLNEPEAGGPGDDARLWSIYARTYAAIRAAERAGHGHRHVVLLEPSILFSDTGTDTPVPFANDGDVAYAPHIYTGTFPTKSAPDPRWFASARALAAVLGGVPVINGEWGGRPRSRDPIDASYYTSYQALDDSYDYSSAYWVFKSSCGDPFEIAQHATHAGALYDTVCATNRIVGIRPALRRLLSRPYPRAVAGSGIGYTFDPATRRFSLQYTPAGGAPTQVTLPRFQYGDGYSAQALGARIVSAPGSDLLELTACPGAKSVSLLVSPGGRRLQSSCVAPAAAGTLAAPVAPLPAPGGAPARAWWVLALFAAAAAVAFGARHRGRLARAGR